MGFSVAPKVINISLIGPKLLQRQRFKRKKKSGLLTFFKCKKKKHTIVWNACCRGTIETMLTFSLTDLIVFNLSDSNNQLDNHQKRYVCLIFT